MAKGNRGGRRGGGATKVTSGKTLGATRGQLGEMTASQGLSVLKQETGFSDQEASIAMATIGAYTTSDYSEYTSGHRSAETSILDNTIDHMGAYNGTMYRGMNLSETEANQFEVGDVIGMGHVSSWTSDPNIGDQFAYTSYAQKAQAQAQINNQIKLLQSRASEYSPEYYNAVMRNLQNSARRAEGTTGVIFQCTKNKTSAGIEHVSSIPLEHEVLAKSTTQWKVTGITTRTDGNKVITVEEV